MVLARGACYRIVAIDERRVDGRLWVAYLLSRKTDSEIVRRAVRYAW
jgi:hypothetical protein